jgi:hypothetical protein
MVNEERSCGFWRGGEKRYGERGAKLTDLEVEFGGGWLGDETGEGEAVEGVCRWFTRGGAGDFSLAGFENVESTCEASSCVWTWRIKTHPPRHRECDRDRDDRLLDHAVARARLGEEQ